MITTLKDNEIFVFGSNLAGRHGAGAALQAKKQFGAKNGVGEGLTGMAYAFPTLGKKLEQLPMSSLQASRDKLYSKCAEHPKTRFLLTKVGCGLAGYPEADMKALFTNAPANLIMPDDWKPTEYALIIRTCNAEMKSHGHFQWPVSGHVSAPDWKPTEECGNGLHGLLWGEGDGGLLDWSEDAKWLACSVDMATIIHLGSKVKFPECEVVFVGDCKTVPEYVRVHGGEGKCIVSGTATAGDRGTATAGDRGTATAGYSGTIAIQYWSGKRYKMKIATVKDEDGEGDLKPNVKYRLNDNGEFVEVV